MTKIQKTYLLLFVFFLALIPVWWYLLVPELLKLPRDYTREFDLHYSINTNYDLSNWTGESLALAFVKNITLSSSSDVQDIESHYMAETLNGKLIWETKNRFSIDRKSIKGLSRNNQDITGSYFLFPRTLQKSSYEIWPIGYNDSFKAEFDGVSEILGLLVYNYSFNDQLIDETESYEWLDLIPDNYHAKSIVSVKFSVEPVTGFIVKYDGMGRSFYTHKISGAKVQDFYAWQDKFNDDTIANQVRIAQNEKQKIILYERFVPVLLGLVSLAFLVALFASRKVALKKE
jgi:hypothetical protein